MKKRFLTAFLLLSLALTVAPWSAADDPATSLGRFLPGGSSICFETSDFRATFQKVKDLSLYRLYSEPGISTLLPVVFKEWVFQAGGRAVRRGQESDLFFDSIKSLDITLDQCGDQFTGRALMGTVNPLEDATTVLLLEVKPEFKGAVPAPTNVFLSELARLMAEREAAAVEGEEPAEVVPDGIVETEAEGVFMKSLENVPNIVAFSIGDLVVCALGYSELAPLFPYLRGEMKDTVTADRQAATGYPVLEGEDATFHLRMAPEDEPMQWADFNASLKMEGKDIEMLGRLTAPIFDAQQWLSGFHTVSVSTDMAAIAPKNPFAWAALTLPNADSIYAFLKTIGGEDFERDAEPEILDKTGLSIRDNILPALGTHVAAFFRMDGFTPDFVLSLDLLEPETIVLFWEALAQLEGSGVQRSEVRGKVYYNLRDIPIQVSVTIEGNRMLVGPVISLRKALARPVEESLASSENFKQVIESQMKAAPNALLYVNHAEAMNYGYPLIRRALSFMQTIPPEVILNFPDLATVNSHLSYEVASLKVSGTALEVRSNGLGPSLLPLVLGIFAASPKRTSNQYAAMATVKNFGSAAVDFSTQTEDQFYWANGTTDFKEYFPHADDRGGYSYQYFSVDMEGNPPDTDTAVKFIYVAVPQSFGKGRSAFYIDEMNCFWELELKPGKPIPQYKFEDITWHENPNDPRLPALEGMAWRRK